MASEDGITVYTNPVCSNCRGTLAILRARGVRFDAVEYLRAPPSAVQIADILERLDDSPGDLVRKDANFRALGLDPTHYTTARAVAELLAEHPQLMQRPVVVRGERAVIARPPEKVEALL